MSGGRKARASRKQDGKAERQEYWKFTQWFRKMQNAGNRMDEPEDHDYLTSVEFEENGQFLATGDKSGNIVILESDESKSKNHVHYSFFAEFTSHYAEFDFVKSQPVEEAIKQIRFGPSTADSLSLITTNVKEIKLWKVKEKEQYKLINWNIEPSQVVNYAPGYSPLDTLREVPVIKKLRVPKKVVTEKTKMPNLRKAYAPDVHEFNITSLNTTSDKMSLLSGDNLRINLWDINIGTHAYNVLDIRPESMDELSEVISSTACHPSNSHSFLYSTNVGNILTCDLRQRAIVDEPCQVFCEGRAGSQDFGANSQTEEEEHVSFFNEMTQHITAAKYSKGGKFIFSRDFLSVKIWDTAMERAPVETIYVHEYLRPKLWDLYTNEFLWDPFDLGISSKGNIVTGSYSNYFHIFDLVKGHDTFIQASQPAMKTTNLERSKKKKKFSDDDGTDSRKSKKKGGFGIGSLFKKKKEESLAVEKEESDEYPYDLSFESLDFSKKVLNCAWHPEKDAVAIAGQNNLYVYAKTRK